MFLFIASILAVVCSAMAYYKYVQFKRAILFLHITRNLLILNNAEILRAKLKQIDTNKVHAGFDTVLSMN